MQSTPSAIRSRRLRVSERATRQQRRRLHRRCRFPRTPPCNEMHQVQLTLEVRRHGVSRPVVIPRAIVFDGGNGWKKFRCRLPGRSRRRRSHRYSCNSHSLAAMRRRPRQAPRSGISVRGPTRRRTRLRQRVADLSGYSGFGNCRRTDRGAIEGVGTTHRSELIVTPLPSRPVNTAPAPRSVRFGYDTGSPESARSHRRAIERV